MKKWIIILLAFLFVSQSFVNVAIGLHFYLNKTHIIQTLCENRDVPDRNCNGHCFYAKQLKKAEQNERSREAKWVKEKEEIVSQRTTWGSPVIQTSGTVFSLRPFCKAVYFSDYSPSLVKPPAL